MNDLYVEIGFIINSPWKGKMLINELKALIGYGIDITPRLNVIKEIVKDEEAFYC